MIRYDIDPDDLHARVERHAPGWLARAQIRTDTFRASRKYEETSSIWSTVKPVFIELQGDGKCCFCERQFESGNLGRHELDLEHFRPKGNIKEWLDAVPPILDRRRRAPVPSNTLTTPPAAGTGYYLLSYHLLNYAVACKACNSGLKKDYFPVAGPYDPAGDDPHTFGS